MIELNLEEIKERQLDILSLIDTFCKENNIKYSLGYGTLLGAVRHKGYIPWDDDIDIFLYRTEYDKLMRLFPKVYDGNISIVSIERNPKWDRTYAKAYDIETVYKEKVTTTVPLGVNIDIFPIDDVPDNESDYAKYDLYRKKNYRRYQISCYPFRSGRSVFKNIYLAFLKCAANIVGRHRIALRYNRIVQENNNKGYSWCCENSLGIFCKRFPKSVFDDYIDLPFEDKTFRSIKDYDCVLTALYGNYMQLPPVEKRITHHNYRVFLK